MSIDNEIKKFALLIGIEEKILRDFIFNSKKIADRNEPAPVFTPPSEPYSTSPEARRGGGGIVSFLERVWLPVMRQAPGVVDLRLLRRIDRSAALAIDNLKRRGKKLPDHLDIPTKRELVDRELVGFKLDAVLPARTSDRLARARRRRPAQPRPE